MFLCSNMSKGDILRGIISEKLSTAAREILAVVERTVADYEQEAAGLRQEVQRQRRQLELLQPRLRLHRGDVEEAEGRSLPWSPRDGGDGGDGEAGTICTQNQVDLKETHHEASPRSVAPRIPSVWRRPSTSQTRGLQDHVDLKVRFLEDPEVEVLSNSVFQSCPVQNLRCPRGLQEADFLDLLRSTFPQLANEPFDIFMSGLRRRLMPVRVKALTPEEIHTTMKSTGNSSLSIQLKTKELQVGPNVPEPPSAGPVLLDSETGLHSSPVDSVDHTRGDDLSTRSGPEHQDLKTGEEEAENDMDSRNSGEEVLDGDGSWTPDTELKTCRKPRSKKAKLDVKKTVESAKSCKVCGVWYWNLGSLIIHTWSHVDEQQNVCGVCGEKFESVEELKEHLRNHKNVHICSRCGKTFISITSLNRHTTKHTGNSQFKCNVCNKTFAFKHALNAHLSVHVEEKPYRCDVCPKSFGLKSQLTAHRRTHTDKDTYHCKICGKTSAHRKFIILHRLIHSEEKRHGCKMCGKHFKLPSTLRAHMKTHTVRDRSFLCHICSKDFPTDQRLRAHLSTHSSERSFVCDLCSKAFSSKQLLNSHCKCHSNERPFECSECGRAFKVKSHLRNHLLTHSNVKQFVCGICGKACYRAEHLKVHMRTHNGERPYKCTLCDKSFTQSHCLKTHMKSHHTKENPVHENQTKENPIPDYPPTDPSDSVMTSSVEPLPFSGQEHQPYPNELPHD